MEDLVFKKEEYVVLEKRKEGRKNYIVVNTKKKFEEGHTHLKSYKSARCAVDYAIKKKVPRNTDLYFLVSLIRITRDEEYRRKLTELVEVRKQKGKKQSYRNRR